MACVFALGFIPEARAQFKKEAFSQSYVDPNDSTAVADSTDQLFSFKDWGAGMAHKKDIKIGTMFVGSLVLPGTAQIYNKHYWKLPVFYSAMGTFAGLGGYYRVQFNKSQKAWNQWSADKAAALEAGTEFTAPEPLINTRSKQLSNWMFLGLGLSYWACQMDGVACFEKDNHPLPGRATIYSMLLPGLGQAYNGEYWKIPIYQGGIAACVFFWVTNNKDYNRFRNWYIELANPDIEYTGPEGQNAEGIKNYRDIYRRYRDYSVLATVLVYLLNVIDANVFAYMHDFEVTDNLSMGISPTVIAPDNAYALSGRANVTDTALGVRFGMRF